MNMYQINFKKPISIHFIGIGGISMSGLAEILLEEGFTVSGSDAHESPLTQKLAKNGAHIFYGHSEDNIVDNLDAVVYTAAVKENNPEMIAAHKKNLPVLTRAQLLGQMMANYNVAIGVSGTHGKTTTTSMITQVLLKANADPTISVGGILPVINGNIRVGGSDIFVTEACEYTNSFLSFFPTMEIILNIEEDHLDFFKDLDDIRHSFRLFAENLPANGMLIINGDIKNLTELIDGLPCEVITYGKEAQNNQYSAINITYNEFGYPCFDVTSKKEDGSIEVIGHIQLSVPGIHNVYNSLAAIVLCLKLGISMTDITDGLLNYTGTDRRFQKKGEFNGVTIIDDYAHHPAEIKATLEAAKHYPHNKIWCVFQPHTYTRTRTFMDEFAKSLSLADEVVLADIYPARETNNLGISSNDLAIKINDLGTKTHYFKSFEEIVKFLKKNCINGDLLITMGAGDIVKVGESILKE